MSDKEFQTFGGGICYFDRDAVRDHYDRLSSFYRALWGEHIHHGFWEDGEHLVADVCRGMLCPQLASAHDYTGWMCAALLEVISTEEITPRVKETWTHCVAIARRPEIRALLYSMDKRTRRFVEAFALIQKAYDEGAMAYGMFTARKV